MKIAYLIASALSVGLLVFEAPRGAILTGTPEKAKVVKDKKKTVRGGGPAFIYVGGGGYRGGK